MHISAIVGFAHFMWCLHLFRRFSADPGFYPGGETIQQMKVPRPQHQSPDIGQFDCRRVANTPANFA
jgi:hypothetical protein